MFTIKICGAILALVTAVSHSAPTCAASENAAGADRLTFTCEEYRFSVKYPQGYKVIVARPRGETGSIAGQDLLSEPELYKVTFLESEYEMWPGSFEVSILPNEDALELGKWVDRFMENEEVALSEPDPEDRSIFGTGEVVIDGHEVLRLHLFNYDHTGVELFVAHDGLIYKFSFAGTNPNDPDIERHMAIYAEMIRSFRFER